MPDLYRLKLIEALNDILGGLGDDHMVCGWCEDLEHHQQNDEAHHPDCRIGKAMTLIAEIEEIHRLEAL